MVEKHLEAIRLKEAEARGRLAETGKEAELLLEKARAEGEKLIEETKVNGNELMRSMTAGAKKEAGKEIEKIRAENAKALAELERAAGRNRDKALELIVRTFKQGV
jgi:vacuolar-type H+-ATPase subunit H